MNPCITMEIINNNLDKPWDWEYISMNPNLTMEMINNNPDKPWNWNYISENPCVTMEMINNNPDKRWDWCYINWKKKPNTQFYFNYISPKKNNYDKEMYCKKNIKTINLLIIVKQKRLKFLSNI